MIIANYNAIYLLGTDIRNSPNDIIKMIGMKDVALKDIGLEDVKLTLKNIQCSLPFTMLVSVPFTICILPL